MWDVGSGQQGLGVRSKAAPFNVTPARYGVSKPGGPTFLSCGCLACCRSKKKICCPAEDRFVIVNCQWRSNEGPWGDGRCCFAGAGAHAGAGCLCTQPVFVRGQGTRSWEHPDVNRSGNCGCSVCFASLGDEKLGWRCVVCRFCSACFAGAREIPSAAS